MLSERNLFECRGLNCIWFQSRARHCDRGGRMKTWLSLASSSLRQVCTNNGYAGETANRFCGYSETGSSSCVRVVLSVLLRVRISPAVSTHWQNAVRGISDLAASTPAIISRFRTLQFNSKQAKQIFYTATTIMPETLANMKYVWWIPIWVQLWKI